MRCDIRFKGIEYSDALASHAEERMEKLGKFELKPVKVNVTFSCERYSKQAEAFVQGVNSSFRAKAVGDSYYDCLDEIVRKLSKQMAKEKAKVQHHRHLERTQLARLEERMRVARPLKKAA